MANAFQNEAQNSVTVLQNSIFELPGQKKRCVVQGIIVRNNILPDFLEVG